MAESENGDKTLDASEHKLREARGRGQVANSREGGSLGTMLACLVGVLLLGGAVASRIGGLLIPFLDQPEQFQDLTPQGVEALLEAAGLALAFAILPFFGLLMAGGILPTLLQGSIAVSGERLAPSLARISPKAGLSRLLSRKGLFEFAKSLLKVSAVGAACFWVARPVYTQSVGLVSSDLAALGPLMLAALVKLLVAATLIAALVAAIDVPYQHWSFRREMRMSLQDMRDEMRSTQGDPHVRARLRRVARQRAQRRMMHDVPKATVVITNPTHFAVALRYRRGEDAAPVVVAKGLDFVAQRIREVAAANGVAVMESPPLARALHAGADIGQTIPHEHFEAVAKIIGLVWARRGLVQA
jgi:flagellar biosynthetic protein FlhB